MNKVLLGCLFICTGILYGTLLSDWVYDHTIGYLVQNKWITPPQIPEGDKSGLSRKLSICLYSAILIILGIYLIWNHQL